MNGETIQARARLPRRQSAIDGGRCHLNTIPVVPMRRAQGFRAADETAPG